MYQTKYFLFCAVAIAALGYLPPALAGWIPTVAGTYAYDLTGMTAYGGQGNPGGQVTTNVFNSPRGTLWSDNRQGSGTVSSAYSDFSPAVVTCVYSPHDGPYSDCPNGAVSASANLAGGTLTASSHAMDSLAGPGIAYVIASAGSEVYDRIMLQRSATVILSGHLSGDIYAGSAPNVVSGLTAWADLSLGFTSGSWDEPDFVDYGGITLTSGGYCDGLNFYCTDSANQDFSIPITLPGGIWIDFNGFLRTEAEAFSASPGEGEDSWADFAHTATFDLIVPQDVSVASGSGLFPVVTGGTVPVPPTAWLFGAGLLGLMAVRRPAHGSGPRAWRT